MRALTLLAVLANLIFISSASAVSIAGFSGDKWPSPDGQGVNGQNKGAGCRTCDAVAKGKVTDLTACLRMADTYGDSRSACDKLRSVVKEDQTAPQGTGKKASGQHVR